MAKRKGKSLNQISDQMGRIMDAFNGGDINNPRYMKAVNAFNKYWDNMAKSQTLKNIGKRDRAKNNGVLTTKGISVQYDAKIGRSTYMGLSNG